MTGSMSASRQTTQPPARAAIASVVGVALYLGLHLVLPRSEGGSFFWTTSPLQWVDWLFWGGIGFLLQLAAQQGNDTIWQFLLDLVKSLALTFAVLWAAVNIVDVDLEGLKIDLKQAPEIAAAFAFALGFYPDLLRTIFGHVLQFLQRYLERLLGRSIGAGGEIDEQAYVKLHVDARLQAAYWLAAGTQAGKPGHDASLKRRAGYKVAGFLDRSGFTVNALGNVYIAQNLLSLADKEVLVEIIAHEASHIEQGWWSDSLDQEATAYRRGASVMGELKQVGKVSSEGDKSWLSLTDAQARDEVRKRKSSAPLYGIIPAEQVKGLADKTEAGRQGLYVALSKIPGAEPLLKRFEQK